MNSELFFQKNGYVYLDNFLDVENCQELTNQFKDLINRGETKTDPQCPLSHSIGHTPLFDSLLEQLTPNIELATGKKLHPTYAYARWYSPGEELKIHRDRPSCEISATITLGFEGNQWPIYMGYDDQKINFRKINMQIGDAVVYKGQEMYHWREKYVEGQWQAQVFIHYVDANGPNANYRYDKREKLAHHDISVEEDYSHLFLVHKNAFSFESCKNLINKFESNTQNIHDAEIAGNIVNKKIRDTKRVFTDNVVGVGATLTGIGLAANRHKWKFDITHSNQSEFLKYDQQGHFEEHIDTILNQVTDETRKLTVILILNDDFEGGKLYIKEGHRKIYPHQEAGSVIIFPSFLHHGVEPITSGIRRSMVTWLVGPFFK